MGNVSIKSSGWLWFILVLTLVLLGCWLLWLRPSTKTEIVTPGLSYQDLKIGGYRLEYRQNPERNRSWEELVYRETMLAPQAEDVVSTFSSLYPEFVNPRNDFYIRRIDLDNDSAIVLFGGDQEKLVNQSGSTGALTYAGLVTFALTEDPRLNNVDFRLETAGNHFGPGVYRRSDFQTIWPTNLLETAAHAGDDKAREVLRFRRGEPE